MTRTIKYLGYKITRLFTIPRMLWEFQADDFDGAPDSKDYRCGHGTSVEDCLDQIDFIIEEGMVPEAKGIRKITDNIDQIRKSLDCR